MSEPKNIEPDNLVECADGPMTASEVRQREKESSERHNPSEAITGPMVDKLANVIGKANTHD